MSLIPKPNMRGNIPNYLEEIIKVISSITQTDFWYDIPLHDLKDLGILDELITLSKVDLVLAINELYESETVAGMNGDSPYEIAIANGFFNGSKDEWADFIVGKIGEPGLQGDIGEQGEQGIEGEVGLKGDQGDELTVSGFTNDGDITADVTLDELSNNTYIGGIIGHNGSKKNNKFENVVNNGDITATGASNRFMFAGIVASTAYDMTLDSCQNTGALTLENKQTFNPKHLWYGGIMACISA